MWEREIKIMILNIFNPNKTIAISVTITKHTEIRSYLNQAYYGLGLMKPDYEVVMV